MRGLLKSQRFCKHAETPEAWTIVALQKFAEAYQETIFLKLYGNSNANTKAIFQRLEVPLTPHFTFWRNGAGALKCFHTQTTPSGDGLCGGGTPAVCLSGHRCNTMEAQPPFCAGPSMSRRLTRVCVAICAGEMLGQHSGANKAKMLAGLDSVLQVHSKDHRRG